jgi:hypothetical protein
MLMNSLDLIVLAWICTRRRRRRRTRRNEKNNNSETAIIATKNQNY